MRDHAAAGRRARGAGGAGAAVHLRAGDGRGGGRGGADGARAGHHVLLLGVDHGGGVAVHVGVRAGRGGAAGGGVGAAGRPWRPGRVRRDAGAGAGADDGRADAPGPDQPGLAVGVPGVRLGRRGLARGVVRHPGGGVAAARAARGRRRPLDARPRARPRRQRRRPRLDPPRARPLLHAHRPAHHPRRHELRRRRLRRLHAPQRRLVRRLRQERYASTSHSRPRPPLPPFCVKFVIGSSQAAKQGLRKRGGLCPKIVVIFPSP